MRLAPVAIAFVDNIHTGMDFAEKQSLTTHDGDEAADCCRLLCFLLIHLINRKASEKEDRSILSNFLKEFPAKVHSVSCLAQSKMEESFEQYDPKFNKMLDDRNWNWLDPNFKYSPTRLAFPK